MEQTKTTLMRLKEFEWNRDIEDVLEDLCAKHTRVEDIAIELGVELSTAWNWLVQFGFERRWVKGETVKEGPS